MCGPIPWLNPRGKGSCVLEAGGEGSCCVTSVAISKESGFGNRVTFTFSKVSLCKVSVFIFYDEKLEDSGFLFLSKHTSLCGTAMVK